MENNGDFQRFMYHSRAVHTRAHNLLSQIMRRAQHSLSTDERDCGRYLLEMKWNEMQVHKYRLTGCEFFLFCFSDEEKNVQPRDQLLSLALTVVQQRNINAFTSTVYNEPCDVCDGNWIRNVYSVCYVAAERACILTDDFLSILIRQNQISLFFRHLVNLT